jgi:hypothetical protein
MRRTLSILSFVLVAATALSSCNEEQTAQNTQNTQNGGTSSSSRSSDLTLPAGTSIDVALASTITSETADVGNAWSGSVRNALSLDGRNVIPAGSSVSGTVTGVKPAKKGDRAMLDLGMTSVNVGGRNYNVNGNMESVVAGSTRARNLGAIGAATVVGAIIGHQIGGSRTGTIVGGVVGGGAATGVVAASDGYQVTLKPGTELTFTTSQSVAVRQ